MIKSWAPGLRSGMTRGRGRASSSAVMPPSPGILKILSDSASPAEEKYLREMISDIAHVERKKISRIHIEAQGDEHDDDYIVIELQDDQAKIPFADIEKKIV